MKFLNITLISIILSVSSLANVANAGLMNFTGSLNNADDYTITEFTLNADGLVRGWTDSYNDGAGFDPMVALWAADGSWILTSDDDDEINPLTQTSYDAGFSELLTAGTYYFTVSVYDNEPVETENLFTGSPIPTGEVDSDGFPSANYSVWLDGADDASTSTGQPTTDVPEPSTFAIFALGMMGLVSRRLKKSS